MVNVAFDPRRFPSLKYLTPNPNLKGTPALIAVAVEGLVKDLNDALIERGEFIDPAEYAAGIRKLIEAKDCFVRSVLDL